MLIDVLSHGDQCIHIQLLHIDANGVQQPETYVLSLSQDREQDVLRPRQLAFELLRQPVAVLKDSRRPRGIPVPFHQCDIAFRRDQLLDHTDELHIIHTVLRENPRRDTCLLFHEPHKDMLAPDIALMQIPRGFGSLLQCCLCFICKLLHVFYASM